MQSPAKKKEEELQQEISRLDAFLQFLDQYQKNRLRDRVVKKRKNE